MKCWLLLCSLVCCTIVSGVVTAMTLGVPVLVKNQSGDVVQNAVVFVELAEIVPASPGTEVIVDQIDKEFVPHVRAVQVGTSVHFPNKDNIRHQVYSFSNAKVFEIPLYKGMPAQPILFDKPGVVSLGCNIHDWMSGYIFIAGGPNFSVTDDNGEGVIPQLAEGSYDIRVWHPTLKGDPASTSQTVVVTSGAAVVEFSIETKAVWTAWRGSGKSGAGGYR